MNCDRAMDRILSADADGRLPLSVKLHLLFCPRCAAEARRLGGALALMKTVFPPIPADLSERIMAAIAAEAPEKAREHVSFRNWISVGATIVAAMVLSPFGADFGWIERNFGTGFLLPVNIVLGLVLALYCALFIGTHLTEFSERFNLPRP